MGNILEFRAVRARSAVAFSATGGAAGALRWAASEAVGAAPRIAEVAVVRSVRRTVASARAAGGAGAAAASRAVYGVAEAAPQVSDVLKRLQSVSAAGDRALRATMLAPREWVARNVAGEASAAPKAAAPVFSTQRLAKIGVVALIGALALLGLARILSWMPLFARTPVAPAEQAATLPADAIGARSYLSGTDPAADAGSAQPAAPTASTSVRVEHVVAPGKRVTTEPGSGKFVPIPPEKPQSQAKKSAGDRADGAKPVAEKPASKDADKQTASKQAAGKQKETKPSGGRKSKPAASDEKPAASSTAAAQQGDVTTPW